MSFDIVFNYIVKRSGLGCGAGLDGFRSLLGRLGNPQDKFKIIHIAGTNGKGSVATLTAHTLTCAGYKTGLFVSPHLFSPTERIQIDGKSISKKAFSSCVLEVFQEEEQDLNFFEILTAAALLYFAKNEVQYAVLETGLGGRKDPTNVCMPIFSVITSIGLDHTQYLGSSLAAIATEKAGIIKKNTPVIVGAVNTISKEVISKVAKRQNAPLYFVKEGEPFYDYAYDFVNNQTVLHTKDGQEWLLGVLGSRQCVNACVTYQLARRLEIPEEKIKTAFETVILPARFESLRYKETNFILDGAHNPQAVELLVEFLKKNPLSSQATLLCGFMKDKDYKKMLSCLCPHFRDIILTVPPSVRGAEGTELLAALPKKIKVIYEPDWKKALAKASLSKTVVCTGSFYLVGAVRHKLLFGRRSSVIKRG